MGRCRVGEGISWDQKFSIIFDLGKKSITFRLNIVITGSGNSMRMEIGGMQP